MTPTLESLGIDRLSVAKRITLVQQIWDGIAAETDELPLSEAQPDDVVPWEQVKAETRARLVRVRTVTAGLSAAAERRLKRLIARSERGKLTPKELADYQALAEEVQRIDAATAEALVGLMR